MKKFLCPLLVLLQMFQTLPPLAAAVKPVLSAERQEAGQPAAPNSAAQTMKVRVPDGTPVEIRVKAPVSSQAAKPGSVIEFAVFLPVKIDGVTVIEAGATARGVVHQVQKAGRGSRSGKLVWAIQDVVSVDGSRIPLRFPTPASKSRSSAKPAVDSDTVRRQTEKQIDPVMDWTYWLLDPVLVGVWAWRKGRPSTLPAGEPFRVYVRGGAAVKVPPTGSMAEPKPPAGT